MPLLNVRVSDQTVQEVTTAAERAGQTRSDWLRQAVEERLRPGLSGILLAEPDFSTLMPWEVPGLAGPVDNSTAGPASTASGSEHIHPPSEAVRRRQGLPRRAHHPTCTCYACNAPK